MKKAKCKCGGTISWSGDEWMCLKCTLTYPGDQKNPPREPATFEEKAKAAMVIFDSITDKALKLATLVDEDPEVGQAIAKIITSSSATALKTVAIAFRAASEIAGEIVMNQEIIKASAKTIQKKMKPAESAKPAEPVKPEVKQQKAAGRIK